MGFPSPIFRLIQTIIVGLYQLILCNDIPILMLASPAFLLFFSSAGASHQHVPSGFGGHVGAAEVLLKAKADPNVRAEAGCSTCGCSTSPLFNGEELGCTAQKRMNFATLGMVIPPYYTIE